MGIAGLLWSGTIRSDATPYGDGSRIMPWLSFVSGQDGWPAWNPYRNGGYPLSADPEQFWYLVPFVDPASPWANLSLNLCLFALLVATVGACWLLARRLGVDPVWSAAAALTAGFGELNFVAEQSARVGGFIGTLTLIGVFALLAKRRPGWATHAGLALLTGVSLIMMLQYTIVHVIAIFSAYLTDPEVRWKQPLMRLLDAGLRTAAIFAAGLAVAAITIVPTIMHLSDAKFTLDATAQAPILASNGLGILRFVVPFVPVWPPVFAGFLVVPAVLIGISFGFPERLRTWWRSLILVVLFCTLFLVMCIPIAGPPLAELYANLPIISSMRQFLLPATVIDILVPIAAAMVFAAHHARHISQLGRATRLGLAIYFLVCGSVAAVFGYAASPVGASIATAFCATAAAYFGFTASGRRGVDGLERRSLGQTGMALVALSLATVAPTAFVEYLPGTDTKLHVDNKPALPQLFSMILADPSSYVRIETDYRGVQTLHAQRRGGATFSLYFPRGQAYTFANLSAKVSLAEQRPHWIEPIPCNEMDPRALDLLSVDYLLCRKRPLGDSAIASFSRIGAEKGTILLKRNDRNRSSLRVYCRWRALDTPMPLQARDDVLNAFDRGEVLVPKDDQAWPGDPACPPGRATQVVISAIEDHADAMRLSIDSPVSGLLVIPDNFASGWSAVVNGKPVPIARAFFAYRGIPIAAGRSEISLAYTDTPFWIGRWISIASAVVLLIVVVTGFIRRRPVDIAVPPASG